MLIKRLRKHIWACFLHTSSIYTYMVHVCNTYIYYIHTYAYKYLQIHIHIHIHIHSRDTIYIFVLIWEESFPDVYRLTSHATSGKYWLQPYISWNTFENIYRTSVYILLLFYLLYSYCFHNLSLYVFIIQVTNWMNIKKYNK